MTVIATEDSVKVGLEKVKSMASKRSRDEHADDYESDLNEDRYYKRQVTVQDGGADLAEETMLIPDSMVGIVIGRSGDTLRAIQTATKARVHIADSTGEPERKVFISGTKDAIEGARKQILSYVGNLTEGEEVEVKVPTSKIGLVVGTKAATLKDIQNKTGAKLRVPRHEEQDPDAPERSIFLVGTAGSIENARTMILDIVNSVPKTFEEKRSQYPSGERREPRDRSPEQSRRPTPAYPREQMEREVPPPRDYPPRDYYPVEYAPRDLMPPRDYGRRDLPPPSRALPVEDRFEPPPQPTQSLRVSVNIPREYAKVVIGKGGENINYLKRESSCKVFVEQDNTSSIAKVHISGEPPLIIKAQELMNAILIRNQLAPVDIERIPGYGPVPPKRQPTHSDDRRVSARPVAPPEGYYDPYHGGRENIMPQHYDNYGHPDNYDRRAPTSARHPPSGPSQRAYSPPPSRAPASYDSYPPRRPTAYDTSHSQNPVNRYPEPPTYDDRRPPRDFYEERRPPVDPSYYREEYYEPAPSTGSYPPRSQASASRPYYNDKQPPVRQPIPEYYEERIPVRNDYRGARYDDYEYNVGSGRRMPPSSNDYSSNQSSSRQPKREKQSAPSVDNSTGWD